MDLVIMTALGVGGATMIGALIGFLVKQPSHRASDCILSFASGIMLCAATVGLIIPSLPGKNAGFWDIAIPVIGMMVGAAVLSLIDKIIPHEHQLSATDGSRQNEHSAQANKVLLFVLAIAIHNLPEGIAAGVSFGTGNDARALSVAAGIALQNIPEGMVIIAPMLAAGISKKRTLGIALTTGLVEVVGTLLGYLGVQIAEAVLPFALAFAGGTMLYVISDEMIPETHSHGNETAATYSLIAGFIIMLLFNHFIG